MMITGRWSLKRRVLGDTSRCRIVGGTNLNVGVNESGEVVDKNLWTNPATAPSLWPEAYLSQNDSLIAKFKTVDWYIDSYKITKQGAGGAEIDTDAEIGGGLKAGAVFELVTNAAFHGMVMLRFKKECFGTIKDDRVIKFVGVYDNSGSDLTLQATVSTSRYLVTSNVYDANIIAQNGSMFANNATSLSFIPELRYGGTAVTTGVTFEWGWVVEFGSSQDTEGSDIKDSFQKISHVPNMTEIDSSTSRITIYDEAILGNGRTLALRAKVREEYVSYSYQPIIDVEDPVMIQLNGSQPIGAVDVGPSVNLTLSGKVFRGATDVTTSEGYNTEQWSWAFLKNPGANAELVPITITEAGGGAISGVGKMSITVKTEAIFAGSLEGPDVTLSIGS